MRYNLLKEFFIWDKWSFDFAHREFVFFSLHDEFYNERLEILDCRYKAKCWVKGSFREFVMVFANRKLRKTFTWYTKTHWTSEKLVPNETEEEYNEIFGK